jgi:hypothetical protein
MLMWHRRLWLIDHGAALYFHHGWSEESDASANPFAAIKDHVLLKYAGALAEADAAMTARITPEVIHEVVALVPDAWLAADRAFATPAAARAAYSRHLARRLQAPRAFFQEAQRARAAFV